MCLIALNKKTSELDIEALVRGYNTNSHAFGILGRNKDTGEAITFRSVGHNPKILKREIARIARLSSDMAVHLRFQTHGKNDLRNCHPFKIQFKDGRRYYVMHNGVFREYGNTTDSDTMEFVKTIMTPLLAIPGTLEKRGPKDLLETFCKSNGSKLVILDESMGQWYIVNDKAGTEEGDIWYSNSGYKSYVYPSCKGYGKSAQNYRESGWQDGYGYGYGAYSKTYNGEPYYPVTTPALPQPSANLLTYNKKTRKFEVEGENVSDNLARIPAKTMKELEQEFLDVFGDLTGESLLDDNGNPIEGLTEKELQFLEAWKAAELELAAEAELESSLTKMEDEGSLSPNLDKYDRELLKSKDRYSSVFPGKTVPEIDAANNQDWEKGIHQMNGTR